MISNNIVLVRNSMTSTMVHSKYKSDSSDEHESIQLEQYHLEHWCLVGSRMFM